MTPTHAGLLASHRLPAGLEPSDCPGGLALLAEIGDARFAPDGSGRVEPRTVEVYRCSACGVRLSAADGAVLNAYRPPGPPEAPRP